jgi:hypothetical protein
MGFHGLNLAGFGVGSCRLGGKVDLFRRCTCTGRASPRRLSRPVLSALRSRPPSEDCVWFSSDPIGPCPSSKGPMGSSKHWNQTHETHHRITHRTTPRQRPRATRRDGQRRRRTRLQTILRLPGCSSFLLSPGTGESGARARLASRTAVRCYIPLANENPRQIRSSTGRASPKRSVTPGALLLGTTFCSTMSSFGPTVGPH